MYRYYSTACKVSRDQVPVFRILFLELRTEVLHYISNPIHIFGGINYNYFGSKDHDSVRHLQNCPLQTAQKYFPTFKTIESVSPTQGSHMYV